MHVGYRPPGESAVAVADTEPVVFKFESFTGRGEHVPEIALSGRRKVEHIVNVLVRDDEQVERGPPVRKFVQDDGPGNCFPENPLPGVLPQAVRTEKAYASCLKPLHLCELLVEPIVVKAVESHSGSREAACPVTAMLRPASRASYMTPFVRIQSAEPAETADEFGLATFHMASKCSTQHENQRGDS